MRKIDIAYIAGLVDGEGYIGIKKTKAYKCQDRQTNGYHARLQIRMVDEPAIKFIAENLGGWYYREKPSSKNGKPLFCYQSSDKSAETILKTLLPYLRVKKESANTVLDLRKLQSKSKKYRTKITGHRKAFGRKDKVPNFSFSDDYVQMCESLYLRCKELNQRGI